MIMVIMMTISDLSFKTVTGWKTVFAIYKIDKELTYGIYKELQNSVSGNNIKMSRRNKRKSLQ